MAFTIDGSALHRPLGFELGDAAGDPAAPRRIAIERHARDRPGAAAAGHGTTRWLRGALELDAAPKVVASARGVVDGHGVSLLGFASGRPLPGERGAVRAWLLTDAWLEPQALEPWLAAVAARSFATIAGLATPRPEDRRIAIANGVSAGQPLAEGSIGWTTLLVGGVAVAQRLVRELLLQSFAPDPARIVQVTVSGASDEEAAARVVEALAADPELRDAMSAGDVPAAACTAAIARTAPAPGVAARSDWSSRGEQSALRIDLGGGRGAATRWTAVAARAARR